VCSHMSVDDELLCWRSGMMCKRMGCDGTTDPESRHDVSARWGMGDARENRCIRERVRCQDDRRKIRRWMPRRGGGYTWFQDMQRRKI
jgi:hypothetical protein